MGTKRSRKATLGASEAGKSVPGGRGHPRGGPGLSSVRPNAGRGGGSSLRVAACRPEAGGTRWVGGVFPGPWKAPPPVDGPDGRRGVPPDRGRRRRRWTDPMGEGVFRRAPAKWRRRGRGRWTDPMGEGVFRRTVGGRPRPVAWGREQRFPCLSGRLLRAHRAPTPGGVEKGLPAPVRRVLRPRSSVLSFVGPPGADAAAIPSPGGAGGECLLRSGDGSGDSGRTATCEQKKRPATKTTWWPAFVSPGESGPDGPVTPPRPIDRPRCRRRRGPRPGSPARGPATRRPRR